MGAARTSPQSRPKPRGDEWWVHKDGLTHGPTPWKNIVYAVQRGVLSPRAFVWCDGLEGWVRVDTLMRAPLTPLPPVGLPTPPEPVEPTVVIAAAAGLRRRRRWPWMLLLIAALAIAALALVERAPAPERPVLRAEPIVVEASDDRFVGPPAPEPKKVVEKKRRRRKKRRVRRIEPVVITPPDADLSGHTAAVAEPMSASRLEAVIAKNKRGIRRCLVGRLPAGRIVFDVRVGTDGGVRRVTHRSLRFDGTTIGDCLERRLKRLRFGALTDPSSLVVTVIPSEGIVLAEQP